MNTTNKKFNHAFDIAFSLESDCETGEVSADELRKALQTRLDNLSDDELVEAIGIPFDTYEM